MLICTGAAVDVGEAKREVANPHPGPLESPTTVVSVPLIGFRFQGAASSGEVGIALPREVAVEFHRLVGEALDGKKSDLITVDKLPPGMTLAG